MLVAAVEIEMGAGERTSKGIERSVAGGGDVCGRADGTEEGDGCTAAVVGRGNFIGDCIDADTCGIVGGGGSITVAKGSLELLGSTASKGFCTTG